MGWIVMVKVKVVLAVGSRQLLGGCVPVSDNFIIDFSFTAPSLTL